MRDTVQAQGSSSMVTRWSSLIPYIILAAAFVLIAYYGTAVYNFFIPTVVQRRDFSLGIWMLAAIGGVAAFLSPCAFGMLPAYFGFFLSMDPPAQEGTETRRALRYGLAAAAGMITVAIALAVVIDPRRAPLRMISATMCRGRCAVNRARSIRHPRSRHVLFARAP